LFSCDKNEKILKKIKKQKIIDSKFIEHLKRIPIFISVHLSISL